MMHRDTHGTDENTVLLDEPGATWGDIAGLRPLQRVLLTTDGTVTNVLEALSGEPVALVKLSQSYDLSPADDPDLCTADGESLIRRRILLRGRSSGRSYVYAESVVMVNRLHPALCHDLVETDNPIGKLLVQSRVETFREFVSWGFEPAGDIAVHFGLGEDDQLISRTYRVFSERAPIMVITEKFPASAFQEL